MNQRRRTTISNSNEPTEISDATQEHWYLIAMTSPMAIAGRNEGERRRGKSRRRVFI